MRMPNLVFLRNRRGLRPLFLRLIHSVEYMRRRRHWRRHRGTDISTGNLSFLKEDTPQALRENDWHLPAPQALVFEPTFKCNLTCDFCFQNSMRQLSWDKDLSTEDLMRVVDNIDLPIKVMFVIGGEVFMRRDIIQLLKKLEEKKIVCNITTNGTMITEKILDQLKSLKNIGYVWVSLDGLEERHNKRRGSGFDKTVDAIKRLNRHFPLATNCVVAGDNLGELVDLIRFSKELGVKKMLFEMEMFCTSKAVEASRVQGGLAADEITVTINETLDRGFSYDEFIEQWDEVENEAWKNRIPPVLNPTLIHRKDFFAGRIDDGEKLYCSELTKARIDGQGNLVSCIFIRKSFGSLVHNKLSELWNCDEHRAFRKRMVENNMLPICRGCSKLRLIKTPSS